MFEYVPNEYKTQEMCEFVVKKHACSIQYVPEQFKIKKMCERVVEIGPSWCLDFVPQYRTLLMCKSAVERNIWHFDSIPDEFKTQEMCERTVETRPTLFFEDVPEYFLMPKMFELCEYPIAEEEVEEEEEYVNRERVQKLIAMVCVEACKQRKVQKTKIKEELLPIAWHPDRAIDWCFSEDKKV